MKQKIFQGVATALVTPFTNDDKVDYSALGNLIDEQLSKRIDALVILGTTGEPATLSSDEKNEILKYVIARVQGRIPVIAGAGSNSTNEAMEKAKLYESFGVNALLIVTPYYNKCSQEGLYQHYEKIASATSLPIILYNVPGRTGVNMLPSTVKKLSRIENIVALKEASGNIDQIQELFSILSPDFSIYSGDDNLTYLFMSLGGEGVISVSSNVEPETMKELTNSYLSGNIEKSRTIQLLSLPFLKSLFSDINPIPVKTALAHDKKINEIFRLPLSRTTDEKKENIIRELEIFRQKNTHV